MIFTEIKRLHPLGGPAAPEPPVSSHPSLTPLPRSRQFAASVTSLRILVAANTRLADVLSEEAGGDLQLDLRKFHELVPTAPTEGFPHPSKPG
jgi:hypothetical protein